MQALKRSAEAERRVLPILSASGYKIPKVGFSLKTEVYGNEISGFQADAPTNPNPVLCAPCSRRREAGMWFGKAIRNLNFLEV
jgi:hypothetical protein